MNRIYDEDVTIGIVVNEDQQHWTAIKLENGNIWLLDSRETHAGYMTKDNYKAYIQRFRYAFAIVDQTKL